MKRKWINFGILALALTGLSLTGTVRPAGAVVIPVTACGTVISSPGDYQLQNSLVACPKHGVVIQFVSGVTLDLNGQAITGNLASTKLGNGILIEDSSNVTVTGPGIVVNFLRNIDVQTSSHVTLTSPAFTGLNVTSAIFQPANPNSTGIGIRFAGASTTPLLVSNAAIGGNQISGVKIQVAYGVVLNNNVIVGNGTGPGGIAGVDVGGDMHVDGNSNTWSGNGPSSVPPDSTCDVKLRGGASASFTNSNPAGHPTTC